MGQAAQPGSADASGQLILYCRGAATNSRDGIYTQGSNQTVTSNYTYTGACSVDIAGEGTQVQGTLSPVGGFSPGPALLSVAPIAFWTGTSGAVIRYQPAHFLAGDPSDLQDQLNAGWPGSSPYGPPPPTSQLGSGLASGELVTAGLKNEYVTVSITTVKPGGWVTGASGTHLCSGPTLTASFQMVQDTSAPPNAVPPLQPTWVPPTVQEALARVHLAAGSIQTTAPNNYVVFAPTCFWIAPPPQGPDIPPLVENVMGPPDPEGESIVYSYYLVVAPSYMVHWSFGDGTTADVPAASSGAGNCVTHYYKQISGEGSVPAAGATVTASQDVTVIAFVGWVDQTGTANYRCVTPGGGLGGTVLVTQADASAACALPAYSRALADVPLPPKPVYQVRAIPVA